jgi:hypothetical protein
VARVYAEGAQVTHLSLDEPDIVTATLLFRNGAIASILHGTAASSALLSTWSFQTADIGVNATIHDHGRRLSLRREGEDDIVVVDTVENPFEAGTGGLFDAFVSVASGERVDVPGPRDGTVSLLISRCIEQAIETGQPVAVPAL